MLAIAHNGNLSNGLMFPEINPVTGASLTEEYARTRAKYTIGAPELITVWQDPDFDPSVSAFYYVRVLEIPTPRWTAYDVEYFDIEDLPDGVERVHQERDFPSPIWYRP